MIHVVGGGIAGLAAAYRLQQRGHEATVLEAVGGGEAGDAAADDVNHIGTVATAGKCVVDWRGGDLDIPVEKTNSAPNREGVRTPGLVVCVHTIIYQVRSPTPEYE